MFAAVAHGDFHMARLREPHVIQACEILLQNFFQLFMPTLEGIELDQHGAVRRMKVADAFKRFCLKKEQQLPHSLVSLLCDSIAEIDQKRLIACAFESRMADWKGEHVGKSIPPG